MGKIMNLPEVINHLGVTQVILFLIHVHDTYTKGLSSKPSK